ncbi:hypothetical protein CEXT_288061 [Caerostris extrusa]|uniref:Ycf15 n=1 Tax=Caerostris extrusa TaxID=172846 RepID=A0AAV4P5P9_CAEEX|nr:hypothetical protein CEXT_288061 [Caerostris extrusa]
MYGITCLSDSMCSFRTGLLWNYLGRRWPFSPEQNIKWEFNQYFSKAEKKDGNSSRTAFKYTPKWKTLPLFPALPSPLIQFRDPPRDSIRSRHVFLIFRTSGENGSEDGSTSGHSES